MDDEDSSEVYFPIKNEENVGVLPIVIIHNIYKYLNYTDVKFASETCKHWRLATQNYPRFKINTIIKLNSSNDIRNFLSTMNKLPNYRNFHFTETDLNDFKLFIESYKFHNSIHEIIFERISIDFQYYCILQNLTNFEKLTLINCDVVVFVDEKLELNIKSLTIRSNKLDLQQCKNISSTYFNLILFPCLKYFRMDLDTPDLPIKPTNNQMCVNFKYFSLVETLKEFHFITKYKYERRRQIEFIPHFHKNVQLKKFTYFNSDILPNNFLNNFFILQKNLLHLNLSESRSAVKTELIDTIVENLPFIQELILRHCHELNDKDVQKLLKAYEKQLRVLDMSDTSMKILISEEAGFESVITSRSFIYENCKYNHLKELNLRNVPIYRNDLITIIGNLRNIRKLNLSTNYLLSEMSIIDDDFVKIISKYLINLTDLNLCSCHLITNESLIGSNDKPEYSISNLKNLKSLNLSDIDSVNDNTIIHGLKFLNLKYLALYENGNVTINGFKYLHLNCPSIEKLDLHYCKKITIDTVSMIFNNFHRLKSIDVQLCDIDDERKKIIRKKIKNYPNIKEFKV